MSDQPNETELEVDFESVRDNESRTFWVLWFTLAMMVVEVAFGYVTSSMALLADGYHLASHAGALGIAYAVYRLARSEKMKARLCFGTGKLLPLGGFASAITLGIMALLIVAESIERLFHPTSIAYIEAIEIAVVSLLVNLISVAILSWRKTGSHHGHHHHHGDDHNYRSAVVHVLADVVTSLATILALIGAMIYGLPWLDPAMGVIGGVVILRWAYTLIVSSGWELLDEKTPGVPLAEIRSELANAGHKLLELQVWKVGPRNLRGQMIVESNELRGAKYFRDVAAKHCKGIRFVIEERRP